MVRNGAEPHDIDAVIDWTKVEEDMRRMRKDSISFLRESMSARNSEE